MLTITPQHINALQNLLFEDTTKRLIANIEEAQNLLVASCIEDYGTLVGDYYYTLHLLKVFLRAIEKANQPNPPTEDTTS